MMKINEATDGNAANGARPGSVPQPVWLSPTEIEWNGQRFIVGKVLSENQVEYQGRVFAKQPRPDATTLPSAEEGKNYVAYVKATLGPTSERYRAFLAAIRGHKSGELDAEETLSRMRTIFAGHGELLPGFNAFLPREVRIDAPKVVPMDFDEEEECGMKPSPS